MRYGKLANDVPRCAQGPMRGDDSLRPLFVASRQVAIDILAIADLDDKYRQYPIDDRVDNPLGARLDATKPAHAFEILRSGRSRIGCQEVDFRPDLPPDLRR